MAVPPEPVLFSKYSNTICGTGDVIRIPAIVKEPDYEVELVIVIGKGGKNIPKEKAFEHVVGYTVGHDVSARDWQLKKAGGQWMVGKTFDTFAPIGPAIVTSDEVGNPHNLNIKLTLNGQVMQNSNTSKFIFGVDIVVSYISAVVTLRPGDIIFTGTPPGIGSAKKPPVYLKQGDVCVLEIEKLGVLENSIEYPSDASYRKSHL